VQPRGHGNQHAGPGRGPAAGAGGRCAHINLDASPPGWRAQRLPPARARASTLHLVAFLKKNDSESAERRQSAPSARTFHQPPPSARRSRASHPRATERLLQRAMLTQQHTL